MRLPKARCQKNYGSRWQSVRGKRSHKKSGQKHPEPGNGFRGKRVAVVAAVREPLGRGASQEERKDLRK